MGKKRKQKKFSLKKNKPDFMEIHWEKIVVFLLILLPLIYFASFFNSNRMIAGSDYLASHYPLKKWTSEQEEMPLWYSHIFAGVPALGSPVGGPLAPTEQLKAIMPLHIVLVVTFVIFFFLAGLGTFFYLKEIGLSKYAAALGAVIYQFIGNLATMPNAGHVGRAASIALLPLMLFLVHRGLSSKKLLYFILTALVAVLAFYEGHFQMTYYGLLFILAYVVYYLIVHRKENSARDVFRVLGFGLCSIVLICLLMAVVWLPVLGGLGTAARGVERGYEYATSWSMSPHEIIDLVIPTYSGLLNNYWGMNSFKIHLEYFGIVALILAIFTFLLFWKKPYVRFYAISIFVIFLVALGGYTPVFRIFYTIIPGFKLTRAPALIFYLISFCFVILAAIGFETIFNTEREKKERDITKRKVFIISGVILAILVITGVICASGSDSIVQSMQESLRPKLVSAWGQRVAEQKLSNIRTNFPEFTNGVWRTLVFTVFILAMIYLSIKRRIKVWIFAIAAIAITLIDQLPLVAKYLPAGLSPRTYYAADNAAKTIKRDKGIFRVFPTPWYGHANDSYLLYHNIQSAGGLTANPIRHYQEFIGAGTSVMFRPMNLIQYPKFLDMLNIKYLIGPTLPEDISQYSIQDQKAIQQVKEFFSRFTLLSRGQKYSVYLNDSVLPRAYIVSDYQILESSEIMDEMKSKEFDPRYRVILEKDPQTPHPEESFSLIDVKITSYTANKIICAAECPYQGFLVLVDNWHPDWKVFVDGEEKKLYRANYTFRAVHLTPGKHEVVFAYISPYFNAGKIISIIAFTFSIVLCIITARFRL